MEKELAQILATHDSWLELLKKGAAGDEVAMNQLLAEIRPYLKARIGRSLGNRNLGDLDGSDVVQECLLRVWKHAQTLRGTTQAEVNEWLNVIAAHGCFDALRHAHGQNRDVRQQVSLPQDSSGAVAVATDTPSPSQRAMLREEEATRQRALSRLSADDQQVLRLRYFENREWSDIAQQMDRGETAVKRLYYRAVKRWNQNWKKEAGAQS